MDSDKKQQDSAPKLEFSKIIFISIWVLVAGVTIFTCLVTWKSLQIGVVDFSALIALITSLFAEFATGTAFYYWKTKHDNRIKLKSKFGMQLQDEDFN